MRRRISETEMSKRKRDDRSKRGKIRDLGYRPPPPPPKPKPKPESESESGEKK